MAILLSALFLDLDIFSIYKSIYSGGEILKHRSSGQHFLSEGINRKWVSEHYVGPGRV